MTLEDDLGNTFLVVIAIIALAVFAGGALGAYLARVPAWKGGVTAFCAAAVETAVAFLLDIDAILLQCLVFLLAVGLIGGRFGLKLSARQMAPVVIGSILVPAVVALAGFGVAVYLARQ
jgi:hypothetical protein